jgi:hypothetical protein
LFFFNFKSKSKMENKKNYKRNHSECSIDAQELEIPNAKRRRLAFNDDEEKVSCPICMDSLKEVNLIARTLNIL